MPKPIIARGPAREPKGESSRPEPFGSAQPLESPRGLWRHRSASASNHRSLTSPQHLFRHHHARVIMASLLYYGEAYVTTAMVTSSLWRRMRCVGLCLHHHNYLVTRMPPNH